MAEEDQLSLELIDLHLLETAWKRVASNHGSFGVDGVTVEEFRHQAATAIPELMMQIQSQEYFPLPLRKVTLEKKPGAYAYRNLLIPTVRDRIAQTAVAKLLSRNWEESFLSSSFAYRPGRGVDLAVEQIIRFRDEGFQWVLEADISAYFDSISHHTLELRLGAAFSSRPFLRLIKTWIRPETWDGRRLLPPLRRGIPQGSPISPQLANFFLTDFDRILGAEEARLIRYADDFIVLTKTQDAAEHAKEVAAEWLASSGLKLNPIKTSVVSFEQGFHYLGVTFLANEVMIPWKSHGLPGRLVFAARKMPQRELRAFRKRHAAMQPAPEHHVSPSRTDPPVAVESSPMPILYLTQPGAVLRKVGERFLVECDQHVLLDVPAHKVEAVLLFGNVQITTQALTEALDHSIPVSFHTRYGRFRGKVSPGRNHNVLLRIAQYKLYEDYALCLELARQLVHQKIINGVAVLERWESHDTATDVSQDLRASMSRQAVDALTADSIEAVNGHEGAAASAYFEGLMAFNRSPFV